MCPVFVLLFERFASDCAGLSGSELCQLSAREWDEVAELERVGAFDEALRCVLRAELFESLEFGWSVDEAWDRCVGFVVEYADNDNDNDSVVPCSACGCCSIVPNGTVVPNDSVVPVVPNGTVVPNDSVVPVVPVPNGTIVPNGTVVPCFLSV